MRAALIALLLAAAPAAAQEAATTAYSCEDGRSVEAAFVTFAGDRSVAVLSIDGAAPVALESAISASGVRYVGGGLQWWGKGMEEANLAPLAEGEEIAGDPGVTCRAAS